MKPKPLDLQLYEKVKRLADKKFEASTGVYRSAWIVKEYRKRGGMFEGSRNDSGLLRWFKEKWVDLRRPNKGASGYAPCGRNHQTDRGYPLCRPTRRVSSKTPKTWKEVSAHAIKRALQVKARHGSQVRVNFTGGGKSQFFGRKSSHVVEVPDKVRQQAKYAFKLRALGFEGARATGWKRAKQLATKTHIPIEDLRFMRNWFARHLITSYPGYRAWINSGRPKTKEWHKRHAIIAWLTWGGDAAFKWVNRVQHIRLMNEVFRKNYEALTLPSTKMKQA